jgi:hypothetical protein
MRFMNSSTLVLPKLLWSQLAGAMKLDGILPGAKSDELGMYGTVKSLRVTVRRERQVRKGQVVTTGSYTYGHVTLYPCPNCSVAFVTQVFIHELMHAWIHQYHSPLYSKSDTCEVAERFANAGFKALGGKRGSLKNCGSYTFPTRLSLARVFEFRALAANLRAEMPTGLLAWHAPDPRIRHARLEG